MILLTYTARYVIFFYSKLEIHQLIDLFLIFIVSIPVIAQVIYIWKYNDGYTVFIFINFDYNGLQFLKIGVSNIVLHPSGYCSLYIPGVKLFVCAGAII